MIAGESDHTSNGFPHHYNRWSLRTSNNVMSLRDAPQHIQDLVDEITRQQEIALDASAHGRDRECASALKKQKEKWAELIVALDGLSYRGADGESN